MIKEHDPSKEPVRVKASRKWRNHEIRQKLIEDRQKPKLVDPNKEPEIAETITNYGRRDSSRNRFETKFAREIRAILQGHVEQNQRVYMAFLEHRRRVLLKEKLRRLQVAQHDQEVAKR
jgi:hypothetical protein